MSMLWRYQEADTEENLKDTRDYKFYLLLTLILVVFVVIVWLLTVNIQIDL